MYKVLNKLAPSSLVKLFKNKEEFTQYDLRGSSTSLQLPQPKTEKLKKTFSYDGAKIWNSLPADVRDSGTLTILKRDFIVLEPNIYMLILCYYCDICSCMFVFFCCICICVMCCRCIVLCVNNVNHIFIVLHAPRGNQLCRRRG